MDGTRRGFLTTAVAAVGVAATRNLADSGDQEHDPTHEAAPVEDTIISTRLTERFGIRHPIVCAPMAYITGGALAAAVSHAGGLGVVAGGYAGTVGGEPDLEAQLTLAKAGKFGVGFITWALERAPNVLTKALQHSPFCVFLSFGDPRPFAADGGIYCTIYCIPLSASRRKSLSCLNIPDRSRTCNLRLRRPTLYPIELRGRGGFRLHCKRGGCVGKTER